MLLKIPQKLLLNKSYAPFDFVLKIEVQ